MKTQNNILIQCKDLLDELNLNYISIEKQEELINQMSEIIYDRILLKALNTLKDGDATMIIRYLDEGKEEEAEKLLLEKIPGLENILKEEVSAFQKELAL
ncbi:MAG TPA: hypothetical protein PKI00_00455 [Candidatus Pacearchaeota archaeon]|nr:hypothetical protein [Candidatus Pacearchaeota archaeon]HOC53775.1 hypothetical protein [Candidatus Pacearchaeota archaeon]HQM24619.1 hypothetical protein [Candidatus Pacearchaeota archaeon]